MFLVSLSTTIWNLSVTISFVARDSALKDSDKDKCGFCTFVLFISGLGLRDMLLVALRPPFLSYEGERERRGDIDRRCKGAGERELSRRGERERMRSRPRDEERGGIASRKLDGFG